MKIGAVERRHVFVHTFKPSDEVPLVGIEARAEDSAGDQLPKIVGYSAVFGVDTEIATYFGSFIERIQKGAFRRAIREGQNVRGLRNHDPDNLLASTAAKTLTLREDDIGLYIEIDPPNTSVGRDTVELIKRGDMSGQSFAMIPRKVTWISGNGDKPDIRIIQDVDLFDVGPVTYPQYTQTSVDTRSASLAYQIGLAELGRPVPPMPLGEVPIRVLDVGQGENDNGSGDERSNCQNEAQNIPEIIPGAIVAPFDVAQYRRRLALNEHEAFRNSVRTKLLTK